ncbi:Carbon-monoxide dehydrogenase form II, large subunit [Caenispirillum salinarum AK4]|uniref:Carbon-monoxide dehydrogenase form II, large subunit n=1 Tax=Caenispirillum salinarum AK4 TaxID=1238182 RepID=K9H0I8_9PROT|nr:xanthine dehydrogenase family protein molybdopterin-binding subunit [Caenispirillum salinarum]EKV31755.1 Carbon-monoxide dehydrogenase form II, large subunit [Caenispirillum salinarum AK4]
MTVQDKPTKTNGIGASVKRVEDRRFLTGKGRYTDDMNKPGQLYAYILRSPHAHARILSIDTTDAEAAPGVETIITGQEVKDAGIGGLPCGWLIKNKDGSPMKEPAHLPLAVDKVRHVGDQVAVVVADSLQAAKDAAELIVVDYEELPAVVSPANAESAGVAVHDEAPNNVCYDWEWGDKAATEDAFAKAAHTVKLDLINNRMVPNAMEPRAAIGEFDPGTEEYTLTTTSQNPQLIRLLLCGFTMGLPEHKVRVVAPDVGGGFGSKIFHYAEEVLVVFAARKLARPVKWTAERSESFMSDAHGRDHVTHAELALDDQGTFLGLRVNTIANMGAFLSTFASSIPTILYATLLSGQYKTPAIYAEVKAVFTNTVPVDAYRGAGRPEACYLIERIVDAAARKLGMDRAEIRRRNFITPDMMPYDTPVGLQYDSGDFAKNLSDALEMIDYAGFAVRKEEAAKRGKLRGIGFASYIEACGIAPSNVAGALGARAGLYDSSEVRFHPTGTVSVMVGVHSHGQGHATTFAQIVSERLGVPMENIEIVHGDSARTPFGMGTYGSRSLAVGGMAMMKAIDKVIAKSKKIAAHLLEASADDIEFENGVFTVAGTDKSVGIAEIAGAAYVPHNYPLEELEPGLDEQAFYDPKNFTFPNGTQICEVEVDPETGITKIVRFVAVDDFGRVINPMIVEGQVHGGIVQGIGQALLENCVYDEESGQLVTGSYMDYAMPRADDVPAFEVKTNEVLCQTNALGVKGCGEAGTIGGSACVMNAVCDALDVDHMDMPATPERVWRVLQSKQQPMAAE